jgi:hypothetical protein
MPPQRQSAPSATRAGDDLGERLLALVLEARSLGLDAEGELRRVSTDWERRLRIAEQHQARGADAHPAQQD